VLLLLLYIYIGLAKYGMATENDRNIEKIIFRADFTLKQFLIGKNALKLVLHQLILQLILELFFLKRGSNWGVN
jgi:hypothetical protein